MMRSNSTRVLSAAISGSGASASSASRATLLRSGDRRREWWRQKAAIVSSSVGLPSARMTGREPLCVRSSTLLLRDERAREQRRYRARELDRVDVEAFEH